MRHSALPFCLSAFRLFRSGQCASLACILLVLTSPGAGAAPLPQAHPYQRTLRDWMKALKPEDFAVEPKPFGKPAAEFSEAQKYRQLGPAAELRKPRHIGNRLAVRITRHGAPVLVSFERPQRVGLSLED
jgi:hypothetical protein